MCPAGDGYLISGARAWARLIDHRASISVVPHIDATGLGPYAPSTSRTHHGYGI